MPRQLARAGLASPDSHLPLQQRCSGQGVALNRCWQAVAVRRFLLATRPDKLPALLAVFGQAGATDLGPQLGPGQEVLSFLGGDGACDRRADGYTWRV
jgi:hypothetical protein